MNTRHKQNMPSDDSPDDVSHVGPQDLEERLLKYETENAEYLAGWQRAKADFSNYKKEEAKRFEEFVKFSTAGMIQELIHILDSFDLGLQAVKDIGAIQGMQLIKSQLEDVLKKYGVERIAAAKGSAFDPGIHEAVGEVDSAESEGAIAEEVSKGYFLHGKVLRPTRVLISKIKGHNN